MRGEGRGMEEGLARGSEGERGGGGELLGLATRAVGC